MKSRTTLKQIVMLSTVCLVLTAGRRCYSIPYASGINNNAGTISFILNESADDVKVIFDAGGAGNTNAMGALTKGAHSFPMGAHSTWQIRVTKATPQAWALISDDSNVNNQFYAPRSVAVNRDPATASFGRVYVLEHASGPSSGTTGSGRTVTKGIFALNGDLSDALGQGNTGLTGGLEAFSDGAGSYLFGANSRYEPWKVVFGEDNHLYVSDAQNQRGAVARVDANIANGELVLAGVGNTTRPDLHTVVYGIKVTGSLAGGTLSVLGIDGQWQSTTAANSVLRWSIGSGPLPAETVPSLVAAGGLPTSEQDSDLDVAPDGNIFVHFYRSTFDASGPSVRVFSPGGVQLYTSVTGTADAFLNTRGLKVSPDGTKLAILRNDQQTVIIGLTNGPNGRVPDVSNSNLLATFTTTAAHTSRSVDWDIAGNLYVANNNAELLRVWSPGGGKTAITKSDGTFQLVTPTGVVSVTATTPTANEQGPVNGLFTLTRTGDTGVPLTVTYTVGGTAIGGSDYTALPGSVTFPIGVTTTNLTVAVSNDATPELTETVILTIDASLNYGIGTASATVSILDNEPTEVSIALAQAEDRLLEGYSESKLAFQVIRKGLIGPALTVNLGYAGTAVRGTDFNGPTTVGIAANAATATFSITSLDDELYEGPETAAISVLAGGSYNIGTPATATATIIDDDYPAGTVLFADNFEINSAANWITNSADSWFDSAVDFAFDYSTLYVPMMPGSTTTKALRFRLNEQAGAIINAVSASPLGLNLSGDFRLKFKMWINYNGPMFNGGAGSTMQLSMGVGTTADHANLVTSAASDGIWFDVDGDGGSTFAVGDCNAYIATALQDDLSGVYAAGTINNPRATTHPFYALWGGIPAPAAQLANYPGQTGTGQPGNMGVAWHTVVLTKANNVVTWAIDGILIATVPAGSLPSGNVFVGFEDLFNGASGVPAMTFALVDNLKVETYTLATAVITDIKIVGSNVEIYFHADASDEPSSFGLQSSGLASSGYGNVSATITEPTPGNFKAVRALTGPAQFYRIKRL